MNDGELIKRNAGPILHYLYANGQLFKIDKKIQGKFYLETATTIKV